MVEGSAFWCSGRTLLKDVRKHRFQDCSGAIFISPLSFADGIHSSTLVNFVIHWNKTSNSSCLTVVWVSVILTCDTEKPFQGSAPINKQVWYHKKSQNMLFFSFTVNQNWDETRMKIWINLYYFTKHLLVQICINQIIKSNKWKYTPDCTVSWVSSVPVFRYTENRNLLADLMNVAEKPSNKISWQTDLN